MPESEKRLFLSCKMYSGVQVYFRPSLGFSYWDKTQEIQFALIRISNSRLNALFVFICCVAEIKYCAALCSFLHYIQIQLKINGYAISDRQIFGPESIIEDKSGKIWFGGRGTDGLFCHPIMFGYLAPVLFWHLLLFLQILQMEKQV